MKGLKNRVLSLVALCYHICRQTSNPQLFWPALAKTKDEDRLQRQQRDRKAQRCLGLVLHMGKGV